MASYNMLCVRACVCRAYGYRVYMYNYMYVPVSAGPYVCVCLFAACVRAQINLFRNHVGNVVFNCKHTGHKMFLSYFLVAESL